MQEQARLLDAVIHVIRAREQGSATVAELVADIVLKDSYRKADGTFPTTREVALLVLSRPDVFKVRENLVTFVGPKFPY